MRQMRQQLKVEGWLTKGAGVVLSLQQAATWRVVSGLVNAFELLLFCSIAVVASVAVVVVVVAVVIIALLPSCIKCRCHSPPLSSLPMLLLFLINVFRLPFPSAFVTFLCFFFSRVRWKNFAHNNKMAAGIFESCALAYAIEMVTLSLPAWVCLCGRSCCCSDKQAACFASPSPSPAPLAVVVVAVDVYFVFFCCSCCCRLSAQRLKSGSFFG